MRVIQLYYVYYIYVNGCNPSTTLQFIIFTSKYSTGALKAHQVLCRREGTNYGTEGDHDH